LVALSNGLHADRYCTETAMVHCEYHNSCAIHESFIGTTEDPRQPGLPHVTIVILQWERRRIVQ